MWKDLVSTFGFISKELGLFRRVSKLTCKSYISLSLTQYSLPCGMRSSSEFFKNAHQLPYSQRSTPTLFRTHLFKWFVGAFSDARIRFLETSPMLPWLAPYSLAPCGLASFIAHIKYKMPPTRCIKNIELAAFYRQNEINLIDTAEFCFQSKTMYPDIVPIPYQVFYILIPTISILGNSAIVYVTVRSKWGFVSIWTCIHSFSGPFNN